MNDQVETEIPLIGTQLVRINNDFLDLDHIAKSGVADLGWLAAWFFLPCLLFMIVGFWEPDLFKQGNKDFQLDFLLSVALPLFTALFVTVPTVIYSAYRIMKVSSCRFDRQSKIISLRYRGHLYQVAWDDLKPDFKQSSVAYSGSSYRKAPSVTFDLIWQNSRASKLRKFRPILIEDERREYWMAKTKYGTERELWQAVVLFMESGPDDINILPEPDEVQVIQLGYDNFAKSMERISPLTPSTSRFQIVRVLTVIFKVLAYIPGVFANILWFSIIYLLSDVDKKLPGGAQDRKNNVTQKMIREVMLKDEKFLIYKEVLLRRD